MNLNKLNKLFLLDFAVRQLIVFKNIRPVMGFIKNLEK